VTESAVAIARASFLRACELDVAVRKPGNVSQASAGHGMQAALFSASAQASVEPLFRADARVGDRIEAAVKATWAVAGCNTNLGILLLCAPVARAVERQPDIDGPAALTAAIERVLADLDLADTQAAYRAIARAHPGGLGTAPSEDVHAAPTLGLREAMALAADRDTIARLYRDGFGALLDLGLPALAGCSWSGSEGIHEGPPAPATIAAVQRVYLSFLGTWPDSHIVRKHGEAVAQTVMRSAQAWQARARAGADLDADPAFAEWDAALKAAALNPGTSADLTVATLFNAGVLAGAGFDAAPRRRGGHGS
jgi:triphosphoribosyl-dephospho-CoA synthase